MNTIDATHDPARASWVTTANGHNEFPIQNIPFGSFSAPGRSRRIGIAIGDEILDLGETSRLGWLDGIVPTEVLVQPTLNLLMSLGGPVRRALRTRLSDLLRLDGPKRARVEPQLRRIMVRADQCTMHLPADIGDYTDFYAGIQHATNAARMRNTTASSPLHENYRHLPIAYHGRASSIRPSGYKFKRPRGQRRTGKDTSPAFGPTTMMDYEAELGFWVGPGNAQGEPIAIARAAEHIWGYCLLNDLSARDIQRWEMVPLGPFMGKNFVTVVSPWIVTPEALAPFRVAQRARPTGDPQPLDYLWSDADQTGGAIDLEFEAYIRTPGQLGAGLPPHRLSRVNATELYWTPAQMVAHHASNGCNLRPGDLIGTGTISGPTEDSFGSLMELTDNGNKRIKLDSGESRLYLENGDEIIFRAHCRGPGRATIGFGRCTAVVGPAS